MTEAVDNHSPYIPNTEEQQGKMLARIGVTSIEDLFADIPGHLRNPHLGLPPPMDEQELSAHMRELAGRNRVDSPFFLGAGRYRHHVPAVVGHIQGLPGLYSAYTPYQAEISQGTLTAAFEAETMMCELMGMEVANVGMYDGATALAEAALMAARVTGRSRVVALSTVHPNDLDTVGTYLFGKDIALDVVSPNDRSVLDQSTACVLLQSPNYLGFLDEQRQWIDAAHEVGALGVVSVSNILSLGLLKRPGEYGADIAVGEGSSFGSPVIFGGANLGIFTTREEYIRQMPGRIVGRTTDAQGRVGYVLTFQPREQHIKRERATSNICTAAQLVASGFAARLSLLGPQGLRELAIKNYDLAHYAREEISRIPGFKSPFGNRVFFNEFVAKCPVSPGELNRRLLDEGIIGGLDVSDMVPRGMLLCVTEMNPKEEIDQLVATLRRVV